MSAREQMLGDIRAALRDAPPAPDVPRRYRQAGERGEGGLVELFCERVADYHANVVHVASADEIDDAITAVCATRGSRRLVCAPGVEWTPGGDTDSPEGSLDAADAAVTGCALAIAETGTIVLDSSPVCGRRALTLVPDHHICVVFAAQVVADVPDAIAALADAVRAGRPLTFVSGPSATSDIELERVEGVHGPRKLDVLLVSETDR